MAVQVHFLPNNVKVDATVGEPLLKVAERAGILIPTGCLMGSCHACEVAIDDEDVCGCITSIPPGKPLLTVHLFSDPTW